MLNKVSHSYINAAGCCHTTTTLKSCAYSSCMILVVESFSKNMAHHLKKKNVYSAILLDCLYTLMQYCSTVCTH